MRESTAPLGDVISGRRDERDARGQAGEPASMHCSRHCSFSSSSVHTPYRRHRRGRAGPAPHHPSTEHRAPS